MILKILKDKRSLKFESFSVRGDKLAAKLPWLRLDTILMLDLSRRIDTPIVLKMLEMNKDDIVLDVGCGDGKQTVRLFKANSIVGLEIERAAAILAKGRSRSIGMKNMQVVIGDAQNMPFKNSVITKVLCNCTLEHVPDDQKVIREVQRVLATDGFFVLTVPNQTKRLFDDSVAVKFVSKWPQSMRKIFLKKYFHNLNDIRNPSRIVELLDKTQKHFHFYTLVSLKRMLRRENFEITLMTYYEKVFGAAAQNIKYMFKGDLHLAYTVSHVLFPILLFLSWVDRLLSVNFNGYGIAVRAIKKK